MCVWRYLGLLIQIFKGLQKFLGSTGNWTQTSSAWLCFVVADSYQSAKEGPLMLYYVNLIEQTNRYNSIAHLTPSSFTLNLTAKLHSMLGVTRSSTVCCFVSLFFLQISTIAIKTWFLQNWVIMCNLSLQTGSTIIQLWLILLNQFL